MSYGMWYMAVYSGMTENAYGMFESDEKAVLGFVNNVPAGETLLEIYRCADDECLTPADHPIWH